MDIREIAIMEKINIAELLKDCPQGMELYSPIYGLGVLTKVTDKIHVKFPKEHNVRLFRSDGKVSDDGEIMLFPKGKTTWEGFQRPFKDGDILISGLEGCENKPFIFKQINGFGNAQCHCAINCFKRLTLNNDNWTPIKGCRLATEEEKQKLFDAIKANGYKWNAETKTLEKLLKFKVGDKIRHKTHTRTGNTVTEIKDTHYILDDELALSFTSQDQYELVPNKFDVNTLKPFDKVLTRANDKDTWVCNFYSHSIEDYYVVLNAELALQCIPYEQNKHLLGTTNDCDEYYKTWE